MQQRYSFRKDMYIVNIEREIAAVLKSLSWPIAARMNLRTPVESHRIEFCSKGF